MHSSTKHKQVLVDFEIDLVNGAVIKGQRYRLPFDCNDEEITDRKLSDAIVHSLSLLMVGSIRSIVTDIVATSLSKPLHVDLSHMVYDGLMTYKGLPAPKICDFLSRDDSRQLYNAGTEFQIGRIDMVSNTGTYIDSPFHRFEDGKDIAELELSTLAGLSAVLVRMKGLAGRGIDREALLPFDVQGKAVLVETGWARNWGTEQYFEGHPYLTRDAAEYLKNAGAALVGIDSYNIDDTEDGDRPVHTILLGAGIPIVEHMCNLEQLPPSNFTFTAVPAKVAGMGTFPVRAFATLAAIEPCP